MKKIALALLSQCLSGSGCSNDQENYNWTTAGLNSELFINSHFDCSQFVQEINANVTAVSQAPHAVNP